MSRIANILRADELHPGDVILNPNHPFPWWQSMTVVGAHLSVWPGTKRARVVITVENPSGVRTCQSLMPDSPAGKIAKGSEVWAGRIVKSAKVRPFAVADDDETAEMEAEHEREMDRRQREHDEAMDELHG